MTAYKQLQKFKKDELILNTGEARIILKFIFEPVDHRTIESLIINDTVREFTQGLLIEAIDASYAVGFVEAIFRSATNPTKGAIKALKSFGKKAAKKWFKHASVANLQDVKVYEFVRIELARRFRTPLRILASTASLKNPPSAFLNYNKAPGKMQKVWG